MAVGLLASTMVCKVILGTLAKKSVPTIQIEILAFFIFPILILISPVLFFKKVLILAFFVTAVGLAGVFSYQIVHKISEFLEIPIFTV